MRHLRLVLGPLLLVAAFGTSGAPLPVASASDGPGTTVLPFPGGGSILFMPGDGWSLGDSAFGIVTSVGAVHGYLKGSRNGPGYAYWDPADPRRILAGPVRGNDLARFSPRGSSIERLATWRHMPYLQTATYSWDGRYVASKPRMNGALRVVDLQSGTRRDVAAPPGYVSGWSPWGEVVLTGNHGRTLLFDPRGRERSRLIGLRQLSTALPPHLRGAHLDGRSWSWSSDGDGASFSVVARRGDRTAILIGSGDGRISDVIRLGSADLYSATWSPSEDAVAYLLSGDSRWRAGVFDVATGRRTTVAADLSSWWPPAWSPDGRWLLIDDRQHERWVFAARDGSETRTYPELGSYPRWGGSTFASPPANVHIPYC